MKKLIFAALALTCLSCENTPRQRAEAIQVQANLERPARNTEIKDYSRTMLDTFLVTNAQNLEKGALYSELQLVKFTDADGKTHQILMLISNGFEKSGCTMMELK